MVVTVVKADVDEDGSGGVSDTDDNDDGDDNVMNIHGGCYDYFKYTIIIGEL